MKADFTRRTFNATKHYSRVLMQQGRMIIDADWNEQVAIHHHYLRRLAADVIGPCGGPAANLGFTVAPIADLKLNAADFQLSWGHYYVDGVLCELGATPVPVTGFDAKNVNKISVGLWTVDGVSFAKGQYLELFDAAPDDGTPRPDPLTVQITDIDYTNGVLSVGDVSAFNNGHPKLPCVRRITTYLTQPDLAAAAPAAGNYHVYLDVSERLVDYIGDDSIRDVALGGPDTAARAKVVWQVKLLKANPPLQCLTPQGLTDMFQPANLARLKARAQPTQTSDDPCTISPDALYTGPENQLYRVEVHDGNVDETGAIRKDAVPTFKWSRDNGSAKFAIRGGGGTNVLTLESFGRDGRFGLREGDFVEVLDDDYMMADRALPLLTVQSLDRTTMTVVLEGTPDAGVGKDPSRHPYLRRWDQKEGDAAQGGLTLAADNAAEVPAGKPNAGTWLELEDGVQVQFSDPAVTVYRPGDYWLVRASVATGDVEWPFDSVAQGTPDRVALLPMGTVHRYAPLATILVGNAGGGITVSSCQSQFTALVDMNTFAFRRIDGIVGANALAAALPQQAEVATAGVQAQAPAALEEQVEVAAVNTRVAAPQQQVKAAVRKAAADTAPPAPEAPPPKPAA